MNQWDVLIRLLLAILIGGAIGYDREFKNRPAGFRTHILVCVGATVAALIEVELGYSVIKQVNQIPELANVLKVDYGRVIAQVISGVGFLGAGTIIRNKGSIKGLTTAASIWAVACVGIAIGMGFYAISILSALIIVIVLVFLKKFQNKFITRLETFRFEIIYENKAKVLKEIDEILSDDDIDIKSIVFNKEIIDESRDDNDPEHSIKSCIYSIEAPRNIDLNGIISDVGSAKSVLSATIVK